MYDLSWLNPTPHAIAVYASQPLSPVATQHSLPSGRYSLLGPDLHRLDRTSFAWRTYSITSSANASRVGGTVMPSALAVFRFILKVGTKYPRVAYPCGRRPICETGNDGTRGRVQQKRQNCLSTRRLSTRPP